MKKLALLLFFIACYFPLFLHLDSEPLYHWDEARNGINALEMIQQGNPLVRTYNGEPETWETKPPLLVWLQVAAMQIVGYNELGVRLPSALAALFTIFLILRFFIKDLDDLAGGIFAGLTLVCTAGYVKFHVSRTGDHDALLAFFLTAVVLYFFKYLRSGLQKNTYLYLATFAVLLGVLTKSIMGFMMLPGILLFTIFKKQFLNVISKKAFWLAFLVLIFSIAAYYFAREQVQPGYLKLVWDNELFPRFFNTSETQNYRNPTSKFHYINLIIHKQFLYFIFLFPLFCLLLFLKGEKRQKLFSAYLLTCIGVFLLIISFGTINSWYDAPVFPLLAMLMGMGFSLFLKLLLKRFKIRALSRQVLFTGGFTLLLFSFPYYKIIQKVYLPNNNLDLYGKFFKQLEQQSPPADLFVYYTWRNSSYLFYEKVYRNFKGWKIESCGFQGKFDRCKSTANPQQQIMICNDEIKRKFEKDHSFEILAQMDKCRLYQLKRQ